MARINKVSITLCALLLTSLTFSPLAQASEQTRASATEKTHFTKASGKKNKSKKTSKTASKTATKASKNTAKTKNKTTLTASKSQRNSTKNSKIAAVKLADKKCLTRKGYKNKCLNASAKPLALSDVHKVRMQKAQKTAMSKLMNQIGKPYHWGGSSPRTGFDCSGLVYYAYKDLVKIPIPRTANEMYHLRDAAPIERRSLESGDLVFFRTQGRGTADHVGVYVGNGKFIQSPRSGQDIQISSLSEDYWVRHYVGARRVMTAKTIR